MTIFVLDDEPRLLRSQEEVLRKAVPEARVMAFSLAGEALRAIREGKAVPDVVFSDIEMPGMSGLSFAVRLKSLCPEAGIVFVTAFPQYALEAYRLHAGGYVMKPLEEDRVREEMESLFRPFRFRSGKLQVRCFGEFEVFRDGKPLLFRRRKTRELFAFLVDREGGLCSAEEIITALWEGEEDPRAAKTRLRGLVFDLRHTLEGIGLGDALIRKSGQMAIRRDALDCDYYRLLEGDLSAVNAYRGVYMAQFSWAEETAGRLYFRDFGERR